MSRLVLVAGIHTSCVHVLRLLYIQLVCMYMLTRYRLRDKPTVYLSIQLHLIYMYIYIYIYIYLYIYIYTYIYIFI